MTARYGAAIVLAAVCAAGPARAQGETRSKGASPRDPTDTIRLTLRDARAAVLRANPELIAARAEIDVARGNLRQASLFRVNPSIDVLGAGAGNRSEIGVAQEIDVSGQRGARRAVAAAGASRAAFAVSDRVRETLADVDRAFYLSVASDRRAALAADVLTLNERLAQAATRQLREGEISKLDYNLSVVELGRSRARAIAARREQQVNTIGLLRLAGLPSSVPLVAVFDSADYRPFLAMDSGGTQPPLDLSAVGIEGDTTLVVLIRRALTMRPDLKERAAIVQQANADVTLARRDAFPRLTSRLVSQHNETGAGVALRLGVGVSVPLFNRNQGEIEAREGAARRSGLERDALATRVRAEVEATFRAYVAATEAVKVLEGTVLGPARDNRRLLETAYREGKVGLPVLLLIRNQVIDAEQEYWSAWLAERLAATDLTAALGGPSSIEPRHNR